MTDATIPEQGELPVEFAAETCIVVSCRTCERVYGDEEEGVTVHFTSMAEAVQTITAPTANWWITQLGAQCQYCAATESCEQLGHAWPDWKPCGCRGEIDEHTQQMQYRTCASCGEQEERVAQAADDQ